MRLREQREKANIFFRLQVLHLFRRSPILFCVVSIFKYCKWIVKIGTSNYILENDTN